MTTLYRILWWIGLGALTVGVLGGLAVSIRETGAPPPVPLNATIDPWIDEVETDLTEARWDRAIRRLEPALALQPDGEARTRLMLGRAYMGREDWENAIRHLRAATVADGSSAEAYNNLGIAYARAGRLDDGIAAVRQALRIAPTWETALTNLQRMEANLERESAGVAAVDDGSPRGAARALLRLFYRGDLPAVQERMTARLTQQLSAAQLDRMHADIQRQLGAEVSVLDERVERRGDALVYTRRARFERFDGEVEVVLQLDTQRRLDGLLFRPKSSGS